MQENINSEEPNREKRNYRRLIRYFLYCWLFFVILYIFIQKDGEVAMDSLKEWFWLVSKSAVTAFFTLPFLAFLLILEKDIKSSISRLLKNHEKGKSRKLTKNEDNIPKVSKEKSYGTIFKNIDPEKPKKKDQLLSKFVRYFFYCFPILVILIYNSRNESVGLIVSIFFATILSGLASLLIVCALETEEIKTKQS